MSLLDEKPTLRLSQDILPVESNNFWAYGHSIVNGTGASGNNRKFVERLVSKTLSPIWANLGIGGQVIGQTSSVMTGGAAGYSSSGWTPGSSGWVVLDCVTNSVINVSAANDAQEKIGFQTGLKACLRILRSLRWVSDSDASCVYTGAAWRVATPANINGPSAHATNTSGDKVTITTTASEIILMLIGFPGATNGPFSITVNGSAFTGDATTSNNQTTPQEQYSPLSIRIPNLSGTSTIVLTNNSNTDLWFDGYLTKNPNPPGIIVVKDAIPTPAGLVINGSGTNRTAANFQNFFGYIDSIVQSPEFNDGTIQIANPNAYWDNNMFTSDGVHPNNWGHSVYAYSVLKAAERLKMNYGLNAGIVS